jgi:hypothetical protein
LGRAAFDAEAEVARARRAQRVCPTFERKGPVPVPARYLPIYLNDHLAGSTFGLQLAQRVARENRDNELGAFLADTLMPGIAEDRRTLLDLMARLGIQESRAKVAGAWLGEKLGRLKANGELRSYSPLSRLLELEGLAAGIEGKRALWLALSRVRDRDFRLREMDFERLVERAQSQRDRLESYRLAAACEALR